MKTIILKTVSPFSQILTNSVGRKPSVARRGFLFVPLLIVCLWTFSKAQAVNPPPDGFYPTFNTAEGQDALFSRTTGNFNTAIGAHALYGDTTGKSNTAVGAFTLPANSSGNRNVGVGQGALANNTAASDNVAIGFKALRLNTTTESNVAVGESALAAFNGTTGTDGANTALGSIALTALTSGQENVVVGRRALEFLTDGSNNVVVGWRAADGLMTGDGNTFIGDRAGTNEGPDVSNVICLGSFGDTQAAGQATPNRCYIDNIVGVSTGGPSPSVNVIIDQDGQLGTVMSSRRFKKDIKPMGQASEDVLKLKPVTFHYKNRDMKSDLTPEFGLIAEDVEQVNRDLVVYGKDGKLWSVRYDAVNVMLLNEFLKEHKKVEEQQTNITQLNSKLASQAAIIAQQQKGMQVLTAQLKEQAAQIQKVSAQIKMGQPATKVVSNQP